MSIWSDDEKRILDATYPHHGAYGVRQALRKAGYERSIDAHIKNLRSKLGDDSKDPHYIETVFGKGYRFKKENK